MRLFVKFDSRLTTANMAPAAQPIVIGVADIVNRSLKVEDAREPLDLMVSAINEALKDAGVAPSRIDTLRSSIDSIDVVQTWTWPYPNLPGSISQKLGINARRQYQSPHGGNQPGSFSMKLLAESLKGRPRSLC